MCLGASTNYLLMYLNSLDLSPSFKSMDGNGLISKARLKRHFVSHITMYFIFCFSIKFAIAIGTRNMFAIYFVCLVSYNLLTQAFVLKPRKGGGMKATDYLRDFHPVRMDLFHSPYTMIVLSFHLASLVVSLN